MFDRVRLQRRQRPRALFRSPCTRLQLTLIIIDSNLRAGRAMIDDALSSQRCFFQRAQAGNMKSVISIRRSSIPDNSLGSFRRNTCLWRGYIGQFSLCLCLSLSLSAFIRSSDVSCNSRSGKLIRFYRVLSFTGNLFWKVVLQCYVSTRNLGATFVFLNVILITLILIHSTA